MKSTLLELPAIRYMISINKFKLQMLRLLFLLQLCNLALSACNFTPLVEGITTYSLSLASKGQNSQQYPLPVDSSLSASFALAVRSFEWKTISSWNLTLRTTNQTSIAILLQTDNQQWASISCMLWSITSSIIIGGFGKLQLQETNTSARSLVTYLQVSRAITYENQSVAVVFVVGVGSRPGRLLEFSVVPFRVHNSSIYLNITGFNISEIQSLQLNYLIFSPIRANFQSFGNIIQIPQSINMQYFDISATVPPTQYILYGIVGIQNTPDLRLDVSANNFLLTVLSPSTTVTLGYLYLAPQQIRCGDCPFKVLYQGQCLAECPKDTYLVQFGGVQFCRSCPRELNLQLQPQGKGCICLQGFVMKEQKCVRNFIPISLLVGFSKDMQRGSSTENQSLANATVTKVLPENLTVEQPTKPVQQYSQHNPIFLPLQVIAAGHNSTAENTTDQQGLNRSAEPLRNSSQAQVVQQKSDYVLDTHNQTFNHDNDTLSEDKIDQQLFQDDPLNLNITMESNKTIESRRNHQNNTNQIQNSNTTLDNQSLEASMRIHYQAHHQQSSTATNTISTNEENQNKSTIIQSLDISATPTGNLLQSVQPSSQVNDNTTRSPSILSNHSLPTSASNTIISSSVNNSRNQSTAETSRIPQVPSPILMTPLIVTTGITNSSKSNTTIDCSLSLNTIAVNGRCVCRLGYINFSSICTSLSDLLISSNTPKTVKATEACPSNQVYSTQLQACTCPQGQKLTNQSQCVSLCSQEEVYDFKEKLCICKAGLARIDGVCVKCQKLRTGHQQCYPLSVPLVCRVGYIQSQGYCIKCSSIAVQPSNSSICGICEGGFAYNGRICICPAGYIEENGTCYGKFCGNGQIQQGQSCDDGNKVNGDGCSSQCLIESGFFCKNASEACVKAVCGDGTVNGGEQCDDGNFASGDGCSSVCLVEANVTCVGVPSACFPGQSDNLTLTNLYINANNVFVQLNTGWIVNLEAPILASTFFRIRFLNGSQVGTPYCQGGSSSSQFSCLIIYPQGVPVARNFVRFSYSWQERTGSFIVQLGSSRWQWPLVSRRQ